jgi:hypothetical protein
MPHNLSLRYRRAIQPKSETDRLDLLGLFDATLALWQSDALEEFCFESWAQGEATRFNELRSHSRSDRIELLIELSRFAEAIADSHAQIASNRCWIDRMDC